MAEIVCFKVVQYRGRLFFKIESNGLLIDNISTWNNRWGKVRIYRRQELFDTGHISEIDSRSNYVAFCGFSKLRGKTIGHNKHVIDELRPERFARGDRLEVEYGENHPAGGFAKWTEDCFATSFRRQHVLSQLKMEYFDLEKNKKLKPFYVTELKNPKTWKVEKRSKKKTEASFLRLVVDHIIEQVYNGRKSPLDITPPKINYKFTLPKVKVLTSRRRR